MSIFVQNPTHNFFMKNGSYNDKKRVMALTEADLSQVSNNLVAKLYKSAIEKAHIDFEDIPATKGDITKYSGYADMIQSLNIVNDIAARSNVKIHAIDTVTTAIGNIVTMRDIYSKGYALNREFIMLQYCTMVATCVEATSAIIASFVDYVKGIDKVSFSIIQPKTSIGATAISNLESFNKSVASGEYVKACNVVLKNGNDLGVVRESAVVITAAVITSLVTLVALMRQIVFRFYYNRMKISDYLKMQAMFLQMNKATIEASESKVSPAKRKQIVKKQLELADKLNKIADKLKVESVTADSKSVKEMTREDKTFTLDQLQTNPGLDNVELL